jgi:hypothetical protein
MSVRGTRSMCRKSASEGTMLTEAQIATYHREGVLVVPEVLDSQEVTDLRRVIVAVAANVDSNDDVYDLEPTHSRSMPRVRRFEALTKVHPIFDERLRHPKVLAIPTALIGPALRMPRLQAEHEVGAIWFAGRMAPGLGILPAHQ